MPISNGCFNDDTGISDMATEQQSNILALFEKSKNERMEIGWISEEPWNVECQGRDVKLKWSL